MRSELFSVHYLFKKRLKKNKDHKDLDVWKKSMDLVVKVYQITQMFPDTEKYGLTSQMRRAAVSIPSNIAEGAARKGDKELVQFLSISIGSLSELETQYLIAIRLGFVTDEATFNQELIDVKKLLIGFKNYINKKC